MESLHARVLLENQCLAWFFTNLDEITSLFFPPNSVTNCWWAFLLWYLLIGDDQRCLWGTCDDVWTDVYHQQRSFKNLVYVVRTEKLKLYEVHYDYKEMFFSSLFLYSTLSSYRPCSDASYQLNTKQLRSWCLIYILARDYSSAVEHVTTIVCRPTWIVIFYYYDFSTTWYSWIADPKLHCEQESQVVDRLWEFHVGTNVAVN